MRIHLPSRGAEYLIRAFAVTAAICLLSGCVASTDKTNAPPASESAIAVPVPAPVSSLPALASADRWHPKTKLYVAPMTQEVMLAMRAQALDQTAIDHSLGDIEIPALVRWIYPEEISSTIPPCLAERGFAVTTGLMGYSSHVPESQQSAFNRAEFECTAMYSLYPQFSQPPTRELLSLSYDYVSEFVVPCLSSRGIRMEIPTKQAFLDDPAYVYNYPFSNVEASAACPLNPPAQAMLGIDY